MIYGLQSASFLESDDKQFASDLVLQFARKGYLSEKQWYWASELLKRNRRNKKLVDRKRDKDGIYVYCIANEFGFKVGVAVEPEKRLKDLQTANPRPLDLLGTIKCRTRQQAMMIENHIHERLKAHNMQGEWFDVSCLDRAQKFFEQREDRK